MIQKKLIKIGKSTGVILPPDVLKEKKLKQGDRIDLEFKKSK